MLKETATAIDSGAVDAVLIVARWEEGLAESEAIDAARRVHRVRTSVLSRLPSVVGKMGGLLEWHLRSFAGILRQRPVAVNPHSLPVLPFAVLIKLCTGAVLIYDTHELESETVGASGARKKIGRLLERACMPFVDQIVVVNRSIADWYSERHPKTPVLSVRNVPLRSVRPSEELDLLRDHFSIPAEHLVFLYQGVLYRGRGIEFLCEVFAAIPADRHMVFLGYGELEGVVRTAASAHPNIHFHEAVAPMEVLRYTSSADVGVSLIENVCLSYYLSLPNKLFEYVSGGVPFIASDFPEMRRFAEETDAGWVVPVDRVAVGELIRTIDRDAVRERRARALAAREHLSWEEESVPLAAMYERLLS